MLTKKKELINNIKQNFFELSQMYQDNNEILYTALYVIMRVDLLLKEEIEKNEKEIIEEEK